MHKKRKVLRGKGNPVSIGTGNNMAFRRSELLRVGGFNERLGVGTPLYAGEDTEVFYRMLESGGTVVYTPDAVIYHSQPDDERNVVRKKREYSISAAALLAARARHGDCYAAVLLIGKLVYECVFLLGGGLIRLNRCVAAIGWHSFLGSLSGLRYVFNGPFCSDIWMLSRFARRSGLMEKLVEDAGKTGLRTED